MNDKSPHRRAETDKDSASQSHLDESKFIRSILYSRDKSSFARYRELVFRSYSFWKLLRYEFLITFIGPIPGALGLILRKRLYRFLFRKVGKGVIFGRNLTLHHADQITLGDHVVLDRDSVYDARGAGEGGITIGDRVIVNRGAAIQAKVGRIEIGDDCNIGSDVDLIAQGPIVLESNVSIACKAIVAGGRYVVEHPDDELVKQRFSNGPIRIGKNVRIGMGAIIQDGVSIGENSIVAAGAVVYESVPAETVMWGNPARPVRQRVAEAGKGRAKRPSSDAAAADTSELQRKVCQYLEQDLFIEFGPNGSGVGDSLLESGIMDSLALVRLLLWVEREFDVELDLTNLDPSEIDSVKKIVGRIAERMP